MYHTFLAPSSSSWNCLQAISVEPVAQVTFLSVVTFAIFINFASRLHNMKIHINLFQHSPTGLRQNFYYSRGVIDSTKLFRSICLPTSARLLIYLFKFFFSNWPVSFHLFVFSLLFCYTYSASYPLMLSNLTIWIDLYFNFLHPRTCIRSSLIAIERNLTCS